MIKMLGPVSVESGPPRQSLTPEVPRASGQCHARRRFAPYALPFLLVRFEDAGNLLGGYWRG